jgi:hypothetical protein
MTPTADLLDLLDLPKEYRSASRKLAWATVRAELERATPASPTPSPELARRLAEAATAKYGYGRVSRRGAATAASASPRPPGAGCCRGSDR